MAKFRKKPVVVEAITFNELWDKGIKSSLRKDKSMPLSFYYGVHSILFKNEECFRIPTLEGVFDMTPSDMLITGIDGEVYPCKLEVFEKTYNPVT